YTIAIENAIARQCRHLVAGQNHADEVEGIGGADADQCILRRLLARTAQCRQRLRQGVLSAGNTRDETAAANFAARFQTSQHAQHIGPWRQPVGFASQQSPEHYTITAQQCASHVLDHLIAIDTLRAHDSPAPRILYAESDAAMTTLGAGERFAFI